MQADSRRFVIRPQPSQPQTHIDCQHDTDLFCAVAVRASLCGSCPTLLLIIDASTVHREVLIEKHYRSVTPRAVCDSFWDAVTQQTSRLEMLPVIICGKYYVFSVSRGDLWLVATLTAEASSLLVRVHRMSFMG